MSGRHPFRELTGGFAPDRRFRVDAIKRELLALMPMHELGRAWMLTRQELADRLEVSPPVVAEVEQRSDMHVSSLRCCVEAVGGQLKIVAEFPEDEIAITNFSQIGRDEDLQWQAEPGCSGHPSPRRVGAPIDKVNPKWCVRCRWEPWYVCMASLGLTYVRGRLSPGLSGGLE